MWAQTCTYKVEKGKGNRVDQLGIYYDESTNELIFNMGHNEPALVTWEVMGAKHDKVKKPEQRTN